MDIIEAARSYALNAHGEQRYGDLPYEHHLSAVVAVLTDFGYVAPEWLAAGWLHDVIEDTEVDYWTLDEMFTPVIAQLVWAVTGEGEDREARNANIYDKIGKQPLAAILKVADRIANVEHSKPGSKHRVMYQNEQPDFWSNVAKLVPAPMQTRLEEALVAA